MKKPNLMRMNLIKTSRYFVGGIVIFLHATTLFAGSPGSTTANFLKIGIGARGSAMGEAQSAIANDVNASYWNPAGLSTLRFQEISLMHYSLIEGVRYQVSGAVALYGVNQLAKSLRPRIGE